MACGICRKEGHNCRTCPQHPNSKKSEKSPEQNLNEISAWHERQNATTSRAHADSMACNQRPSAAGGKRISAPGLGWKPDADDEPVGKSSSQQSQKNASAVSTNSYSKNGEARSASHGEVKTELTAPQVAPRQHNTRAQTQAARQSLQQELQKAGLRQCDDAGKPRSLHDWQFDGIGWLRGQELGPDRTWRGGILADEMGLGKTLQMLSLMALNPMPTLLLCTVSGKSVWKKEVKSWFIDNVFTVIDWHEDRAPLDKLPQNAVVICTVETMRADVLASDSATGSGKAKLYKPNKASTLRKVRWGRLVIDEAQCIKNAGTMSHQAALALEALCRWAVTGTPLENNPEDLLSLLKFVRASPYCDDDWFHEHVRIARDKDDDRHPDILRAMFTDTLRRRTKANLGDTLPAKHMATISVPFNAKEAELHAVIAEQQPFFLTKLLRSRMVAGALMPESSLLDNALDRLRRDGLSESSPPQKLQAHADKNNIHVRSGESSKAFQELVAGMAWKLADKRQMLASSSKWVALRGLLEDIWRGGRCHTFSKPPLHAGHVWEWDTKEKETLAMDTDASTKVVIFSQWPTRGFELAEIMLADMGVAHTRIDCSVNAEDRQKAITRFSEDDKVKVLLVGLKSGGASINLQVAQVGILMDLWWNAAVEQQATDRVHRVGSRHAHNYFFKLVAEDSAEARVLEVQGSKLEMYQELLASVAADTVIDLPAGPNRRH